MTSVRMRLSLPRFLMIFVATSVAVPAVLFAVSALFGFDLSSNFVPFVPFLAAATFESNRHVQTHKSMPGSRDMWSVALWMGIVGMLTNLAMAAVFFLAVPGMSEPLVSIPVSFVVIGFAIAFVVAFLTSRLFLWVGARSAFKAVQRAERETTP